MGNRLQTIQACQTARFFQYLTQLNIAYPETHQQRLPYPVSRYWLQKSYAGFGGRHITPARNRTVSQQHYFQRRYDGVSFSALIVANQKDYRLLTLQQSFSTTNTACSPFQFLGLRSGYVLSHEHYHQLQRWLLLLVQQFQLIGINSIDLLLTAKQQQLLLLEINPRISASVQLLKDIPWLDWHRQACQQKVLPNIKINLNPQRQLHTIYSDQKFTVAKAVNWPAYAADLPSAEQVILPNQPICSLITDTDLSFQLNHYRQQKMILSLCQP